MMPQESRKAFINIMTNLIEKSSDAKLLRVITKIVEEWVKSKVCVCILTILYMCAQWNLYFRLSCGHSIMCSSSLSY